MPTPLPIKTTESTVSTPDFRSAQGSRSTFSNVNSLLDDYESYTAKQERNSRIDQENQRRQQRDTELARQKQYSGLLSRVSNNEELQNNTVVNNSEFSNIFTQKPIQPNIVGEIRLGQNDGYIRSGTLQQLQEGTGYFIDSNAIVNSITDTDYSKQLLNRIRTTNSVRNNSNIDPYKRAIANKEYIELAQQYTRYGTNSYRQTVIREISENNLTLDDVTIQHGDQILSESLYKQIGFNPNTNNPEIFNPNSVENRQINQEYTQAISDKLLSGNSQSFISSYLNTSGQENKPQSELADNIGKKIFGDSYTNASSSIKQDIKNSISGLIKQSRQHKAIDRQSDVHTNLPVGFNQKANDRYIQVSQGSPILKDAIQAEPALGDAVKKIIALPVKDLIQYTDNDGGVILTNALTNNKEIKLYELLEQSGGGESEKKYIDLIPKIALNLQQSIITSFEGSNRSLDSLLSENVLPILISLKTFDQSGASNKQIDTSIDEYIQKVNANLFETGYSSLHNATKIGVFHNNLNSTSISTDFSNTIENDAKNFTTQASAYLINEFEKQVDSQTNKNYGKLTEDTVKNILTSLSRSATQNDEVLALLTEHVHGLINPESQGIGNSFQVFKRVLKKYYENNISNNIQKNKSMLIIDRVLKANTDIPLIQQRRGG